MRRDRMIWRPFGPLHRDDKIRLPGFDLWSWQKRRVNSGAFRRSERRGRRALLTIVDGRSNIRPTMKLSRPSKCIAGLLALISILFMQLAVAAYACPALGTAHGDQAMSMESAVRAQEPCLGLDPVQPSLCHAHDQNGNQSLDKPSIPPVQSFIAVGFGLPLSPLVLTCRPACVSSESTLLAHATAPPLAIRHCCFRI